LSTRNAGFDIFLQCIYTTGVYLDETMRTWAILELQQQRQQHEYIIFRPLFHW